MIGDESEKDGKTLNSPPPERLIPIQTKNGKPWFPRRRKLTTEQIRKREAASLVSVIVDAARSSAWREDVDRWLDHEFWLPARLALPLVPADHPERRQLEKRAPEDRIYLRWPRPGPSEMHHKAEGRDNPVQLVGDIMQRILDGDAAFFEAVAAEVTLAKRRARNASERCYVAGKVAAPSPDVWMGSGDSDWLSRVAEPPNQKKAPHAIWKFCRGFRPWGTMTRRDIRLHLAGIGMKCPNLKVTLKRLGWDQIPEGPRPRKR